MEEGTQRMKSVSGADGHTLKAWSCAADKLCMLMWDSYDENTHVGHGVGVSSQNLLTNFFMRG